jgi:hypothetical protein
MRPRSPKGYFGIDPRSRLYYEKMKNSLFIYFRSHKFILNFNIFFNMFFKALNLGHRMNEILQNKKLAFLSYF